MRFAVALTLLALACSRPQPAPAAAAPRERVALPAADAQHLLARLTFGARPRDVAHLEEIGLDAWLDEQLAPRAAPDPAAARALEPFRAALRPPAELESALRPRSPEDDAMKTRELAAATGMTALARHVASDRQLEEVMVDFWTNHFNVFARKGPVRWHAADFVERVIRPHALGRFEELLAGTARHPAMLLYLDNARSVAPGAQLGIFAGKNAPRGLNENYARELLELHTVGIDGGYTQDDVVAAARALTGWSVEGRTGGFKFRPRLHDRGAKTVLGLALPAGGGEEEGVRLLAHLARHPATARHLARELCARFVADDPPAGCVDAAARAWLDSGGDVARVLRAIVATPDFWRHRGGKLRSPLEVVAASLRVLDAELSGPGPALMLARMGQPLFLNPVPTGYGDDSALWSTTSGMMARLNFAVALAAGKLPGVTVDLAARFPERGGELVAAVNARILGCRAGAQTLRTLDERVRAVGDPARARAIAVALALASPEFQEQ